MVARPESEEKAKTLAQTCWQLDELAAAYGKFLKAFGPAADEIADGRHLTGAQAFQLRVLLVHDWRRIVLRDPLLPRAMLPVDWPGTHARALIAGVYRRILGSSERWLDQHAVDQNGALPPSFSRPGTPLPETLVISCYRKLALSIIYVTYREAVDEIGRKACTRRP